MTFEREKDEVTGKFLPMAVAIDPTEPFINPATGKRVKEIRGPRGSYKKQLRKLPEGILKPEEVNAIMGKAKAGTSAARLDPSAALQSAFIKIQYLAFQEVVDILLNSQKGTERMAAAKMVFEEAKGIISKKNANLKNQTAGSATNLTNIQIRGVKPDLVDDGESTEE